MQATTLRKILRWSHIGIALLVGSYFYSPLAELSWSLPLIQFVLVPLLVLTGIAMWKQGKLMKLLKATE